LEITYSLDDYAAVTHTDSFDLYVCEVTMPSALINTNYYVGGSRLDLTVAKVAVSPSDCSDVFTPTETITVTPITSAISTNTSRNPLKI